MFKILFADWSANFAMDDEWKNLRMKEATNEVASLVFSLNLGSEEMPIEEYVQLVGEEIVYAKYIMVEMVNLAWDREIHLGLNLNEVPNGGEWCGWPSNTSSQAFSSPWVWPITIKIKHPLEFLVVDVMNMQSFMDKLNKMLISNINKDP